MRFLVAATSSESSRFRRLDIVPVWERVSGRWGVEDPETEVISGLTFASSFVSCVIPSALATVCCRMAQRVNLCQASSMRHAYLLLWWVSSRTRFDLHGAAVLCHELAVVLGFLSDIHGTNSGGENRQSAFLHC